MVYLLLLLLGLCFGSFVNALVWRLHEAKKAKTKKAKKGLSIINGRSMCVHCRHTLAWPDLLPVVSWLSLGGKCRYCKKAISWQYPVVEITTAILFIVSYIFWPYSLHGAQYSLLFVSWLIFLVGFVAMAVYDLRWMLIPNRLTYPLTVLAVIQVIVHALMEKDFAIVTGAILGLAAVGGLFYVLFQISNGKWIGGGDVKLGFMLGLLAGGFIEGLLLIFVASLLGTLVALPILGLKKQSLEKRIPFGPFLIAATVFTYLFGPGLINWYGTQFLFL